MTDNETVDDIVSEIAEQMFSDADEMALEGGAYTWFKEHKEETRGICERDAKELVDRIIAAHERSKK